MQATMSIRGLYNADNTLFSEMSVCSEMTNEDKQTIVDNILIELAELEVIYSDPVFMRHAIGAWSWKEVPTWDRIYEAAMKEYNPIENYNRTEETTETGTNSKTQQSAGSEGHSGKDTITHSGTDTSTTSSTSTTTGTDTDTNSGSDVLTNNREGFDSNTLVTTGTDTTQHGHVLTKAINESVSESGSASVAHGQKIENGYGENIATSENMSESGNNSVTRKSHISGNIGVTTSQQMLEQELVVAPKLNVYNYIIESFKNRFCLEVW